MQIGQVPIQFVPEPVVNDTRAITMEADTAEILTPSLPPVEQAPAAPVVVETDNAMWGTWAAIAGLAVFAWMMAGGRRRR